MPWSYDIDPDQQIVAVVYTGDVTKRELGESASEFIALEHNKGLNRFLIDTTEMKSVSSLMDVYDLPVNQYVEENADRLGRVALIPPKASRAKEAVRFYETVCQNRGFMVQVFDKRNAAMEWLNYRNVSDPVEADSDQ